MKRLVNRATRYLRIYYYLVKFSILDVLIYRINALFMGLAPVVWFATMILFLSTLFSGVKTLAGWSFWEIVFLTGTHEVIFLLTWFTFGTNLRRFINDVRTGNFDWVLLKPINPRFLASFRFLDFASFLGSFLNVLLVFSFSFIKVFSQIEPSRLIGFCLFLFLAFCLSYLVFFIVASLSLFLINSRTLIDWIFDTTDFDRYPAEIYPQSIRTFLTFFLPILFFAYIPTAFVLGKLGWGFLLIAGAITVFLYLISRYIWRSGLRHYQSASS